MTEDDMRAAHSEFEGGLCNCGKEDRWEIERHDSECPYVTKCHASEAGEYCQKPRGHDDPENDDEIHVSEHNNWTTHDEEED